MIDSKEEKLKKKLSEKDKVKRNYLEKLELVKQHYGLNFTIDYFDDNSINKIKFTNLDYKKSAKNISLIYDYKLNKINFITYDYEETKLLKNQNPIKIIENLNREKKIKLVVAEITRLNREYKLELQKIDDNLQNETTFTEDKSINLEIKKKQEN